MSDAKLVKFKFDPRTKLFVLLTGILVTIFSRSIEFQFVYLLLLMGFGFLCGQHRLSAIGILLYALIQTVIWYLGKEMLGGVFATMLIAGLGFFVRIYPSGMASMIMVSSTKVSELLAATVRLRIPQKIYIPMAVMCRYFPVVREDWRHIRGAMKLRGIYLSPKGFLTKPATTVSCLYVPLMISASKAADELSAAALSRGIENPESHTCLTNLRIRAGDVIVMVVFGIATVSMFFFEKAGM